MVVIVSGVVVVVVGVIVLLLVACRGRARLIFALLVLIRSHYTISEPGTGYIGSGGDSCSTVVVVVLIVVRVVASK